MRFRLNRIPYQALPVIFLLVLVATYLGSASAAHNETGEVRITDVRDTTFTVSWITGIETTGRIHFGTDPDNLDQVGEDLRGMNVSDELHYVKIVGLPDSSTTYYFDVYSGSDLDDNGGTHYTVTTGPVLDPAVPGSLIYGQVLESDQAPIAECIVYINLVDDNGSDSTGQSAQMSRLVTSADLGNWYIVPSSALLSDLSGYFTYSPDADNVVLDAQCGHDGTASLVTGIDGAAPAPEMVLIKPNLINLYLPLLVRR